MALVLFESRVNMITVATPSSIGGFVVGYDTLGVLTQKDHLGVITPIGSGGGIGSLAQTLSIGKTTGTNSIYLDLNTRLRSNGGSASLRLDNNGSYGNYVQLSSSITGSTLTMDDNTIQLTGLSSSVIMNTSYISLSYGANQFLLQNNNSYLKLGVTNVLEFTTATTVRTSGNRVPAFISSDGSRFSNTVNNSVIIGGSQIVGTQSNSVYAPNLIIKDGGYVKGISGDGQLKFNGNNETYLTSIGNIIGLLNSKNTLVSDYSGIFITDIDNGFTTRTENTNITFISSSRAAVDPGLSNTVVIGGQDLIVDSADTVYLGGKVDINNQYKLPLSDGTSGQVIKTDGVGNLSWSSGVGTPVITITATAFAGLSTLSSSSTYRITDADIDLYGGTEIYLTTNSQGILNDVGEGKFYNPKYDQTVAGYKIWAGPSSSYATGSVVYWGGRAWSNISGVNTLASLDNFSLALSEWTLLSYTTPNYNISYDEIKYDRFTNKIIYRSERGTNIVSTNTQNISYWIDDIGLYNPIKAFQWGNVYNTANGKGIGSQNIVNSYNENINFRGISQTNITMNNLSGQYNLNTNTSSIQYNLVFDNYLYDRTLILLLSEYNLVFQGDLPQQNPARLVGKLNNQQVEIDLAATALVTPTIVSRWEIYESDGTTLFGPTVIKGTGTSMATFSVGTFSTSNSVTVPNGCIVKYTGTSSIPAATTGFSTPSTVTGSYTFSSGSYPKVSATLSTTGLSSGTTYTTTISKPKTGLIVSGSQVIAATGSDSTPVSASLAFSNVFYYGYANIGSASISLTQTDVDTYDSVTLQSIVEGLGNYKFGTKAQKFASNDGGAGSRLVFAYPSSLGDLSSLTVTPYPESIPPPTVSSTLTAFIKRTSALSITTISGALVSYTVYIAVADNSYGNGTTVTITTL